LCFKDPFGDRRGFYDYASILARLEVLKVKLADKASHRSDDEGNGDEDEESDVSDS